MELNEQVTIVLDEGMLIGLVEQHPHLYNSSIKSYRNSNLRDVTWRSIASAINTNVDVVKKLWSKLRERYMREKRKERDLHRSGAGAASGGRWQFMHALEFLEPHVQPRSTSGNLTTDSSEIDEGVSSEEVQLSIQSPSYTDSIDYTNLTPKRPKKNTPDKIDEAILECVRDGKLDAEDHYCSSLAFSLRSLDERSRSFVKCEIQRIVHEAKYGDVGM
uniref:uncharacterized protein LOC120326263 n=1 Tax=Styela clava TaxID=7725 RepID=UPI0019393F37|nr:uncharacterized protein LOC120326263 [Styela clava]XP_039260739.1 uncharacterized protein LOC120337087 [Styela clava]